LPFSSSFALSFSLPLALPRTARHTRKRMWMSFVCVFSHCRPRYSAQTSHTLHSLTPYLAFPFLPSSSSSFHTVGPPWHVSTSALRKGFSSFHCSRLSSSASYLCVSYSFFLSNLLVSLLGISPPCCLPLLTAAFLLRCTAAQYISFSFLAFNWFCSFVALIIKFTFYSPFISFQLFLFSSNWIVEVNWFDEVINWSKIPFISPTPSVHVIQFCSSYYFSFTGRLCAHCCKNWSDLSQMK